MTKISDTQLDHDQHQPSAQRYPLSVLAIDVEDVANVGGLFRLADALGIEHLYLCGTTVTPPDNKLSRVSRSTDKAVDYSVEEDAVRAITSLRSEGYTVIALELSIASRDIHDLSLINNEKVCLVVGNEAHGLSDDILNSCDQIVHIPMLGQNSSMNVAMAAAISCWHITNQLLCFDKLEGSS